MTDLAERISRLPAGKRALLLQRIQVAPANPSSRIPRRQGRDAELSYAQERLWFLHQWAPESAAYNIPAVLRLTGRLHPSALERAINEIVRRHEILRTRFTMVDGRPVQRIAADLRIAIAGTDLSGLPEERRGPEIERLVSEETQRPFDLTSGPLLRVGLLFLGSQGEAGECEHLLLFTLHHIVSDGWSVGIFVREIAALYEAYTAGRPSPLSDLPIQYADYAVWQRQWLQGALQENHLVYWRTRLADMPPRLDLAFDRPRLAEQACRGGSLAFAVSETTAKGLYALSRREGTTLFMTLLAAFKVLLYRHSGQDDICVGTPIANRTRTELEGLIGFFVNTLVLRTRLNGNPRFTELLAQVRERALEAQTYQHLPFERLVEELQPVRDMSYNPLFQVMFALQNAPEEALDVAGLRIREECAETLTSKFDLSLDIKEEKRGLSGVFEYDSDLFEAATIERMARNFVGLLEALATRPESRLSELPVPAEDERRQVLFGWNATAAPDYPLQACTHRLFELQVERTPAVVAVVCGDERLTYGELNRQANRIAHGLISRRIGPDSVVGLLAERSTDFLAAILGIMKAGGAYLPLDPQYPAARLAQILEQARPDLILARSRHMPNVGPAGESLRDESRFLALEALLAQDWPETNPAARGTPNHLAYVIFTSGSTGTPKGAMIEHRGLVNNLWSKRCVLGLDADAVVAQTAPQCFDISVWQFLAALLVGGRVWIFPDEVVRDPWRLLAEIGTAGVTVLELVPSMIRALLDESRESYPLPRLRWLLPTGEALPSDLAQRWLACFPEVVLLNAYGPAECSDDVAYHPVAASSGGMAAGIVPIGRPIGNLRLYVIDGSSLQPAPMGVPGELWVGGVGVGRGYFRDPVRTAQAFLPDPYGAEPGARLYRTGDLARYRRDGTLEFLGRIDHQVKLRGQRIELGEIEQALGRHPKVSAAVALVREDTPGNQRLLAYVLPGEDRPAAEELRSHLKALLPDYMVPSAFPIIDALPLTTNGKIDRRALTVPDSAGPTGDAPMAPRNTVEETLVRLWAEILGRESVSIHDNFFELGGHSLSASRLVFKARAAFGVDLPLKSLFEHPTVAAYAAFVMGDPMSQEPEVGTVDLRAEAVLDESIVYPDAPADWSSRPDGVFLTGATGFLGAFLLREILERTGATLYCLVRASSEDEARSKLRGTLEKFGLFDPALFERRVVPVCGDLGELRFGLSESRFRDLAGRIEAVFHSGAMVGNGDYRALKPANVMGTREVLRLAGLAKTKPVHYVSTVDVFGDAAAPNAAGFAEEAVPEAANLAGKGYAQSKWVAEELVRIAGSRGLPYTIYRPAFIVGDSRSGIWNTSDTTRLMFQGCIQLGRAPAEEMPLDWVPVDFVSRAIVALALDDSCRNQAFHLTHPRPLSTTRLIKWINELGCPVESVAYQDWLKYAIPLISQDPGHVLLPLLAGFETELEAADHPVSENGSEFDCRNTMAALKGKGIACPSLDKTLVGRYLSRIVPNLRRSSADAP